MPGPLDYPLSQASMPPPRPLAARGAVGRVAYLAAVALYALIAVIAAAPSLVSDSGLPARAVHVEAVLLTILVFFGVNVAWLLLFEEPQPPARLPGQTPR